VRLSVLALDYDGTIAIDGELVPDVARAIAYARSRGIVVLLVTGRILDELRRVAGDLHFVDGVIAENGAVVHFPTSGYTSVLAPAVSTVLVDELTRRGVPFQAGHCLIDADSTDAPRILEAIRTLELPLVLIFNRARVMTMPQGTSKATGLHAALDILRLSARNTLAIGDAENDHELLRLAELGVAVEWGSETLKSAADAVVAGTDPSAVAAYIRRLGDSGWLPAPRLPRRLLRLGQTEDGREFALAVRGRNVLVAGDAKSGKSWVAGLLCEQLILHGYCVCVIDPEGDYRSLEALPGVSVLGGEGPPPAPRALLRAIRYPDRSIVIDLSHVEQDRKIEYIRTVLPTLNVLRRRTGLPHRILVDEAHYFLHDAKAHELLDLELDGYIVVTYCASRLPDELLAASEVILVTRESSPAEVEALFRCCSKSDAADRTQWMMLARLTRGQAVALPVTTEAGGTLTRFTIGRRLTPHVRHREKYVDVPVTEGHAFVFQPNGGEDGYRARTLRQFVEVIERMDDRTASEYLRRGDFSRWLEEVYGDYALAQDLREIEDGHRDEPAAHTVADLVNAIRSRYDLSLHADD
jgi:hydroxymethylpyrimidine pyrophosphatase-like HAD family hydrolase